MLEFIYYFSVFMIFYAYFGYPVCLMAILGYRKFKGGLFRRDDSISSTSDSLGEINEPPTVSFIITAYNEEKRIEKKILNTLDQDYPRDKLELIVASDCSNDKTDDIVKEFKSKGIILVRAPNRKGKENAQKYAIDMSDSDIIVFSDVATILKPNAISNIVQNFSDPSIGCVSSEDKFIDKDGNLSGEGAYVKYEMFLRSLETRFKTVVGLSGSFFAARRIVCKNWVVDLPSDFNTLLNSIKLGLRGVSDPNSIGYYKNITDEKKEVQRKIRTVMRGISVLMRNLSLFNLNKYGMFSWQLFSHKLCRWLVPLFMILAFLLNFILAFESDYFITFFVIQCIFYTSSIYHYYSEIRKNYLFYSLNNSKYKIVNLLGSIMRLCYFFVTVNFSILIAWMKFIKGQRFTYWDPSKR